MKKTNLLRSLVIMACLPLTSFSQVKNRPAKKMVSDQDVKIKYAVPAIFFKPALQQGEVLGNVFSRTIAVTGDFQDAVFRIGGTGIYTVTDNDPGHPSFKGVFHYDGRPETGNMLTISDHGKTITYDSKAGPNTDGSGLLFNEMLWGTPPERLHAGLSWKVNISQPWELGTPGLQTVKVMEMDAANHSIRLKREGYGEGFFEGDRKQMIIVKKDGQKLKVDVQPGKAHWTGYTTFKNGLVISDELMVTRPLILTADSIQFKAVQRQYILLNAMPTE